MALNPKQYAALQNLQWAIGQATATDMFAEMAADVSHPDSINVFCDDVREFAEHLGCQPATDEKPFQAISDADFLAEINRRGTLQPLHGAIGALYDHLDRTGALETRLAQYLAYRLRLEETAVSGVPDSALRAANWQECLDRLDHEGEEDMVYLTNALGEGTLKGTYELSEMELNKVPFEHGCGAVLPYIVEIKGKPHLLGNLEVAFQHENWGEDASAMMTEDEARSYCLLGQKLISKNLPNGAFQVPLDDGWEDRFVLGVAVPLDSVEDRKHARALLSAAFGCLADLPDVAILKEDAQKC